MLFVTCGGAWGSSVIVTHIFGKGELFIGNLSNSGEIGFFLKKIQICIKNRVKDEKSSYKK